MQTTLSKNVINEQNTRELASVIKKNFKAFDRTAFISEVTKNLPDLDLGARLKQVTLSLKNHLPADYEKALKIIIKSLPPAKKMSSLDGVDLAALDGFMMISITAYVSNYGLDRYELSMEALKIMTSRFSSEFAIRYFIKKYPEETLKTFAEWLRDDCPHVRRLVSEGMRPRLPLNIALPEFKKDPSPVIRLLERLKDDPELYVRRSVANNLNDISKDNPEVVTTLLKKWNKDKSPERKWLIKHALRTLEKQGNAAALKILGYSPELKIKPVDFQVITKTVNLGDGLEMSLSISTPSKLPEPVVIDYLIFHMKANGALSPKVFKWSKKTISKDRPLSLTKFHSIRPISTRKYYSGRHEVHIQVNGNIIAKGEFTLLV
ncbi:DNA alkylation repair enzyme [hydrothermal vent metagenome]|uniref:DNA alkylation repair enzyme n=1 Tax=hydrothermal vent metagenome TaxID=652676 RepID=A0A3B0QUU7_9ZZZZ